MARQNHTPVVLGVLFGPGEQSPETDLALPPVLPARARSILWAGREPGPLGSFEVDVYFDSVSEQPVGQHRPGPP